MNYIGLILCGIAMFLFSIMGFEIYAYGGVDTYYEMQVAGMVLGLIFSIGGVVGLWVSELVKFIKTRKNKNGDSKNHEEK